VERCPSACKVSKLMDVTDLIDLAHLHSSDFARKLGYGGMWGSAGLSPMLSTFGHPSIPLMQRRDKIHLNSSDS